MTHSPEWPGNHGWWCDKNTWTCIPMNGAGAGIYNTKAACERICQPPREKTPGYNCVDTGGVVITERWKCSYVKDGAQYKNLGDCQFFCTGSYPPTRPLTTPRRRGDDELPAFAPPAPPQSHGSIQKWACSVQGLICTKDPNGIYNTLADCIRVCQEPSTRIVERTPIIPTRPIKPVQGDRVPTPIPSTPRGGIGDRITRPAPATRVPAPLRPTPQLRPTKPLKP